MTGYYSYLNLRFLYLLYYRMLHLQYYLVIIFIGIHLRLFLYLASAHPLSSNNGNVDGPLRV